MEEKGEGERELRMRERQKERMRERERVPEGLKVEARTRWGKKEKLHYRRKRQGKRGRDSGVATEQWR